MRTPLLVALLLVSCSSTQDRAPYPASESSPESSPRASAAPPAARSAGREPASPSSIGDILGEDAFKALHQLRDDAAPPLGGTMVDVGESRAYLSLPPGKQPPMAAVIVIHEWWGLNEHIKHWADRLAQDGYAALAVDLYGGKVATTPDQAMATMKSVDDAKALDTLKRAVAFVQTDTRIQATRIASIGWCFGGGWSLRLAMNSPELDAAIIYYGHPIDDPARLRSIKADILGIFGNKDKGIPPAQVDAFDAALDQAGVDHTILRYDAEHAFANPSSARYHHAAAADAWQEVRDFLRARLKQ